MTGTRPSRTARPHRRLRRALLRTLEVAARRRLRRAARRLAALDIGFARGAFRGGLHAPRLVGLGFGAVRSRALDPGRLAAGAQVALQKRSLAEPIESLPGVARWTCHGP